MYTDLGSMFTYPPAARGLLPPCMQPAAAPAGPGGYSPQTQIFGTQEGENKPPCAITFHGERPSCFNTTCSASFRESR